MIRKYSANLAESLMRAFEKHASQPLDQILKPEINKVRETFEEQGPLEPLAADILLLGGDDLLVAVPADRALDFALIVTNGFERLTKEKIADLPATEARFFGDLLESEGFNDLLRCCCCEKQLSVLFGIGFSRGDC